MSGYKWFVRTGAGDHRLRKRKPSDRGQLTHWKKDGVTPKAALTRDEARVIRDAILDADLDAGRLMTHPSYYECPTCGAWHIGNWHYEPPG